MQNVSIPIINDDIVEPIENFNLSIEIQPQFLNIGVMQGTPAVAIGFITDDDGTCTSYVPIYVQDIFDG